jgi:hypothetical protein
MPTLISHNYGVQLKSKNWKENKRFILENALAVANKRQYSGPSTRKTINQVAREIQGSMNNNQLDTRQIEKLIDTLAAVGIDAEDTKTLLKDLIVLAKQKHSTLVKVRSWFGGNSKTNSIAHFIKSADSTTPRQIVNDQFRGIVADSVNKIDELVDKAYAIVSITNITEQKPKSHLATNPDLAGNYQQKNPLPNDKTAPLIIPGWHPKNNKILSASRVQTASRSSTPPNKNANPMLIPRPLPRSNEKTLLLTSVQRYKNDLNNYLNGSRPSMQLSERNDLIIKTAKKLIQLYAQLDRKDSAAAISKRVATYFIAHDTGLAGELFQEVSRIYLAIGMGLNQSGCEDQAIKYQVKALKMLRKAYNIYLEGGEDYAKDAQDLYAIINNILKPYDEPINSQTMFPLVSKAPDIAKVGKVAASEVIQANNVLVQQKNLFQQIKEKRRNLVGPK